MIEGASRRVTPPDEELYLVFAGAGPWSLENEVKYVVLRYGEGKCLVLLLPDTF
jgi:hypothetical protein